MAAKDLGPLSWDSPIVNKDGLPSPEFQRRWALQRDNNALIGSITFGEGAPVDAPSEGDEYVDLSVTPPALYAGHDDAWIKIGVYTFLQLSDVPSSYAAAGLKLVRVNAGVSALEFAALSTILDGISATRGTILYRGAGGWAALAPGTATQVLTTAGPGADPAWAPGGGGGGGQREYEAFGALPLASTFSALNVQSTTLTDAATSLLLTTPGVGGQPSTVWQKASPGAAPWNVYARMKSIVFDGRTGLCVRATATGNILSIQMSGNNIAVFRETVNSGSSSFNSTQYSQAHNSSAPTWFRIQNDGTNLNSFVSHDGVSWVKVASETIAAWVGSADNIGLSLAAPSSASNPLAAWVGSFGTGTPA